MTRRDDLPISENGCESCSRLAQIGISDDNCARLSRMVLLERVPNQVVRIVGCPLCY